MSCWKAGVTIKHCAWYEFKVLVLPRKMRERPSLPRVIVTSWRSQLFASGCLTQPEIPKRRLLFCADHALRALSALVLWHSCKTIPGKGLDKDDQ